MTDAALPSETVSATAGEPETASPKPAFLTPRSKQSLRALGLVIVLLSVFISSGSFLIMTGASDIDPTPEVWTIIWVVNGTLVLMVIALVLTEATLLIQARL